MTSHLVFGQDSAYVKGKEYVINNIKVTGIKSFNEQTVITYTGLFVGKKVQIPGEDISKIINKLWKLELFSDINFYITNIIEDHLDRYENDFGKYVDAKMKIAKNQKSYDYLIYNCDDKILLEALTVNKLEVNKIPIGINTKRQNQITLDKKILYNKKKTIMINTDEFALKGRHNLLNAMAAITVSDLLKIDNDIIRESLMTFSGLPHRLEKFLKIQGVNYINDSKATNVNAAYYALDSMRAPTIWIAGGVDKGNDYTELLPVVRAVSYTHLTLPTSDLV